MPEKVKIVLEVDSKDVKKLKVFNKTLGKTEKGSKGLGSSVKKLRIGYIALAGVLTGVVAAGMGKLVSKASDLEESTAKFMTVFKGVEDSAISMRDELVASFGMSRLEAIKSLSTMQDFLVPMGIARDKAADLSGEFVRLAVDLGSFNNLPTAQVMDGIQSALAGMSRPLRQYGIDVSETTLKNMALERGIELVNGKLDRETRAMLILEKVQMDSADAMGDFKRTQEGFANTMKILGAVTEDVVTGFGMMLLPLFQKLAKWGTAVAKSISGIIDAMNEASDARNTQINIIKNIGKVYRKVYGDAKILTDEQRKAIFKLSIATKRWLGAEGSDRKKLGEEMEKYKEILIDTHLTTGMQVREFMTENETALREQIKMTTTTIIEEDEKKKEINIQSSLEMALLNATTHQQKLALIQDELIKHKAGSKKFIKLKKQEKNILNKIDKDRAQNFTSWMNYMAGAQSSKIKALWVIGKSAAAAQVAMDSYKAAMSGYSAMAGIPIVGPVLGAIAAAAAIAFGAAQISKIAATPPPKAEFGGIVAGSPAGTQVTVGEKNKAEAIVPLEDSPGIGGNTIIIQGDVYGWDDFKEKVDQGLFELNQDKGSRFAEAVAPA